MSKLSWRRATILILLAIEAQFLLPFIFVSIGSWIRANFFPSTQGGHLAPPFPPAPWWQVLIGKFVLFLFLAFFVGVITYLFVSAIAERGRNRQQRKVLF